MASAQDVRPAAGEKPQAHPSIRRGHLVAISLAIAAALLVLLALAALLPSPGWGFDFEAYLAASRRLARGDAIYEPYSLAGPFRPGPYGLYLYPPPLAVMVLPFTMISMPAAEILWYVARVGLLMVGCAAMPVRPMIRLLVFAVAVITSPVLVDMNLGNVSVLVTVLLTFVWRGLDRPSGAIALALGMCLRPTLGLMLVWYGLRRHWRPIGWTLATGALVVLLTLPIVGLDGYRDYTTVLRNMSDITGQANNLDLGSTVLRTGVGPVAASLALFAGYALAIGTMLFSLRYDRETSFMVTMGATLLLAPLLWDHYLAALLLPAAFLANRGRWWGLLLPLLAWLPQELLPVLAIAGMLVPLAARRPLDERTGRPLLAYAADMARVG